ncbi:hypothetical protein FPOA_13611 [Fusarium poae]|uniref:C2H2-type domain-containing protein n=1 Tax=Fusarium poae TaxID=36050 RepID=A0A1B8A516_FUSPO|nr:hypothetical protein FPOA_13611 [Fusarium poae]
MSRHKIKFNAKGRRIRCIAHIINLSLQTFLLASSKEALVAALNSASGVTGEELLSLFSKVLASHRKKAATEQNIAKRKNGEPARKHKRKGSTASNTSVISADGFGGVENVPALRKLHGLAVWPSSSSLHQNAWDKVVGLRLGMDNRTRWSSWYQVIDRAIRKKDKIQPFMSDHEEAIGDNRLLVGDWEESTYVSSAICFSNIKIYQLDERSDERMVRAIDMGWFILSKYYRLTDEVPVYAAALLLDPRKRIAYIKQNWQKEFNYEQPSDHPSTPTSMPPPLAKKPNQLAILSKKLAHNAEKQYECSFCGNRFKNKNEAERHQNSLHVRRHSWSCSALSGYDRAFHDCTNRPGEADTCGYCGDEFTRSGRGPGSGALNSGNAPRHATEQDWDGRIRHLQDVHKFRECNSSKKFFRADHFRQHLKHSHASTSGKWTNMLENACMLEEDPTPR